MAVNHIDFNHQSEYGNKLHNALDRFESGLIDLINLRDTLIQMKDGANFTSYVLTKFGFPDTATATACLAEIEAALAKVTTDSAVSNVQAALNQLFDKLR